MGGSIVGIFIPVFYVNVICNGLYLIHFTESLEMLKTFLLLSKQSLLTLVLSQAKALNITDHSISDFLSRVYFVSSKSNLVIYKKLPPRTHHILPRWLFYFLLNEICGKKTKPIIALMSLRKQQNGFETLNLMAGKKYYPCSLTELTDIFYLNFFCLLKSNPI